VTELVLADGPARYLGGSVETFALPYGAIIVIGAVLYFVFKRPHGVPRMRYLRPAHQTSTGTREPGTAGMIRLRRPDVLPETGLTHPAHEAEAADEAEGDA
jgi:hypothetical protein